MRLEANLASANHVPIVLQMTLSDDPKNSDAGYDVEFGSTTWVLHLLVAPAMERALSPVGIRHTVQPMRHSCALGWR